MADYPCCGPTERECDECHVSIGPDDNPQPYVGDHHKPFCSLYAVIDPYRRRRANG